MTNARTKCDENGDHLHVSILKGGNFVVVDFVVFVIRFLASNFVLCYICIPTCDRGSSFVPVESCYMVLVGRATFVGRSRIIGEFPVSNNMMIASYSGMLE
jgi:hypothetical protein